MGCCASSSNSNSTATATNGSTGGSGEQTKGPVAKDPSPSTPAGSGDLGKCPAADTSTHNDGLKQTTTPTASSSEEVASTMSSNKETGRPFLPNFRFGEGSSLSPVSRELSPSHAGEDQHYPLPGYLGESPTAAKTASHTPGSLTTDSTLYSERESGLPSPGSYDGRGARSVTPPFASRPAENRRGSTSRLRAAMKGLEPIHTSSPRDMQSPPEVDLFDRSSVDQHPEASPTRRQSVISPMRGRRTSAVNFVDLKFAPLDEPRHECHHCEARTDLLHCRNCAFVVCENCLFEGMTGDHDSTHRLERADDDVAENSLYSMSRSTMGAGLSVRANCRCCSAMIYEGDDCYRCEECVDGYLICVPCAGTNRDAHNPFHHFAPVRRRTTHAKSTTSLRKHVSSSGQKILNEYCVVRHLAKGAYGKVKLIQQVKTHELFALKVCNKASLKSFRVGSPLMGHGGEDDTAEVLREIAIMKMISHPNVIKLHEVIDDPESHKVYMILELMDGVVYKLGDPPLEEEKLRNYAGQALKGLLYLHSQVIYHRDIKPENLLIKDGVVKIGDFGVSHSQGGSVTGTKGTPAFLCPEILEGLAVSGECVDAWAFGVTLFSMAFGRLPFASTSMNDMFEEIKKREIEYPSDCDPQFLEILHQLLDPDIEDRADLVQVSQLPYFIEFAIESAFERIVVSDEMTEAAFVTCRKVEKHFRHVENEPLGPLRMEAEDVMLYELSPHNDPFEAPGGSSSPFAMLSSPKNRKSRSPNAFSLRRGSGGSGKSPAKEANLSLDNIPFDRVPIELFNSMKPVRLTLKNNGLKTFEVPEGCLPGLESLEIVRNELTEFPCSIVTVTSITWLSLSMNNITTIPQCVATLVNLETFHIDNNLIKELPEVCRELPSLRHFNASCNPIRLVPPWVTECKDLCLVVDNYPDSQLDWITNKVTISKTVTVLWNAIFPALVANNLFVGKKSHDDQRIISELGVTTVLKKPPNITSPPPAGSSDQGGETCGWGDETPGSQDLGNNSFANWSFASLPPAPGNRVVTADSPGSPKTPILGTASHNYHQYSFQPQEGNEGSPHKPISSSSLNQTLHMLSKLLQTNAVVLVCLSSEEKTDPLYEVVMQYLMRYCALEYEDAEGTLKEATQGMNFVQQPPKPPSFSGETLVLASSSALGGGGGERPTPASSRTPDPVV